VDFERRISRFSRVTRTRIRISVTRNTRICVFLVVDPKSTNMGRHKARRRPFENFLDDYVGSRYVPRCVKGFGELPLFLEVRDRSSCKKKFENLLRQDLSASRVLYRIPYKGINPPSADIYLRGQPTFENPIFEIGRSKHLRRFDRCSVGALPLR